MRTLKNNFTRSRMFLAALILSSAIFFTGCTDHEKENLKVENAQLRTELKQTEASVNDMLETFSEVEQNLAAIKEKQGMIMLDSNNPDLSKDARKKVVSDIKEITDLMEENRKKISDLQSELSKSGLKIVKFQKKVNSLLAQLTKKEQEIEQLKNNLSDKDFEIAGLNTSMSSLHSELDTLNNQVALQNFEINKMDEELNTSYFAEGTFKELKDRGIVTKVGWTPWTGKKLDLNDNLSKDQFAKFDKREVTSIPLNAKKVELVSDHPEGSYEFEKNDEGLIASLEIKQPDEFWKLSKYLVVEVK